jgi:hypothetical protein
MVGPSMASERPDPLSARPAGLIEPTVWASAGARAADSRHGADAAGSPVVDMNSLAANPPINPATSHAVDLVFM